MLRKTTTPIEADGFAIYNEGADVQALVDEANAVVDQIAAIGEVTSVARERCHSLPPAVRTTI